MKKMCMAAFLLVAILCLFVSTAGAEKVYRTYLTTDCPILNGHDSVETQLQTPHNYCSSPLYRAVPTEDGKGYTYIGDLAEELPV